MGPHQGFRDPDSPWGANSRLPDELPTGYDLNAVPDMTTVSGERRLEPLPPEALPKPETEYVPEVLGREGFRRSPLSAVGSPVEERDVGSASDVTSSPGVAADPTFLKGRV
jgi:hypothetical protein